MSIDQSTGIRPGEELNLDNLKLYLKQHLPELSGEIKLEQFPSGYSNLTYFLQVGNQELVLRRPPFGANIKGGHDMEREFRVLSSLEPIYPKVPHPIHFCGDEEVLGAPFYLMRRVRGIILRNRPPKGLELGPELMRKISLSAVDTLAELHSLDLDHTGLRQLGKPEGYVQRQVIGWIERYYRAETDDIQHMHQISNWLKTNMPRVEYTAFIHNDFKYDNLVLSASEPDKVIAVLDWEMATVGDPYMDLGTTLAYWCEANDPDALKPFNLTWLPGNLTRAEVIEHYAEKRGAQIPDMLFYYVFGAFKIGVIVQQIYARYKKGLTSDPRFAALIYVLKACANNAVAAIERGRV